MLKITELKNARIAADDADSDDYETWSAASRAANAAEDAERSAAMALKAKYEAMPETDSASGITNARDTFGGHVDSEISVEFWDCALRTLEMMRDFGDTSGL